MRNPLRDLISRSKPKPTPIDRTDGRGDGSAPALLAPNSNGHLWEPELLALPGPPDGNPPRCIITHIRANDVAVNLGRIPVGFYVAVHAKGTHQRTRNKPVAVHDRHVEWDDEIFLPSEPSSSVHLRVCASYELSPMLGNGETLGTFVLNLGKLFRKGETVNFKLSPPEGGPVLRCSLLRITAELCKCTPEMLMRISTEQSYISNSEVSSSLAQITDEGHEYRLRYQKHKKPDDLNHSISCFERALQACPPTDQRRAAALFNLATVQFILCQDNISPPDFDIPITLYRDALELRPLGHPDRPATLSHLARAIVFRYRKWGDEAYAEEAKNLISQVKSICSADSYEYLSADEILHECAFHGATTGSSTIVSPSSARVEGNNRRVPDHGTQEPATLIALAFTLAARFEQSKRMDDINGSISLMEKAVELTEENDPEWPMRTIGLAAFIEKRFFKFQNTEDLDRSISVLDKVVRRVPNDYPDRPVGLIDLSLICFVRFCKLGQVADRDRSLATMEEALELATVDHPNRSAIFIQSGVVLLFHYKRLEDPAHLDRSISLMEGCAQDTMDDSTPEQSIDLFTGTCTREEMLKIFFNRKFMEYKRVTHLAQAYDSRFYRSGDRVDLDKSIAMKEEALKFNQGARNPEFLGLSDLGGSLFLRHGRFGSISDLHASTSLLEEAARLAPNDHPQRSEALVPFGLSLFQRSDQLAQIVDADRSISMQEAALQSISDDDPDKHAFLCFLAISYFGRFQHLKNLADLDRSICILEEALRLVPAQHPQRNRYLTLLATIRALRLMQRDQITDLDEPIAILEEAMQTVSDGDQNGVSISMCLLNMLGLRSLDHGNTTDPDKWISMGEKAVSRLPAQSPSLPRMLSCLSTLFLVRFMHKGCNVADLDKSSSLVEKALNLTPEHHSSRQTSLMVAGTSYFFRFLTLRSIPALRSAITYFSCSARSQGSSQPLEQFKAFKLWHQSAIFLRNISPSEGTEELLEAFKCAIGLFPRLAWLGLPFKDRYTELREAADITRSAVSFVVSLGQLVTAVEWLEQGRCVVWAQSLALHTPLDQLRQTHPDLADQFEWLSSALQRSSAADDISLQCFSEEGGQEESLDQQARRHRELVTERENLLELIQTIPGFEGCFSPKTFSQLQVSARLGPVIILNVRAECGYALILLDGLDGPLCVALPDINEQEAERLRTSFRQLLLNDGRVISREGSHRAARVVGQNGGGFSYVLSELWTKVVKPVLHTLGFFDPGEPARVFWCPTGPLSFLPIHAAGNYDAPGIGHKVSDFVISSYIPTLSVLLPSPERTAVSDNIRLLAVPQPLSDGQTRLYGTQVEIEGIRETISRHSSPRVQLDESDGDVKGVLSAMEQSDWVHFACHGVQDGGSPTDSGLCLADGRRLRLSDIIRLSRPRNGLAFLSACQTATGAVEFSEEAVHLSAGMLFAGYSSVIGTMWSIGDSVAPQVAKDVYEQLFHDGRTPDSREAARALHYAVDRLRRTGAPFIAWVPFIHMGV